jgi:hypothetical protein
MSVRKGLWLKPKRKWELIILWEIFIRVLIVTFSKILINMLRFRSLRISSRIINKLRIWKIGKTKSRIIKELV